MTAEQEAFERGFTKGFDAGLKASDKVRYPAYPYRIGDGGVLPNPVWTDNTNITGHVPDGQAYNYNADRLLND